MTNQICFYHKVDLDGVCSGAIVKHFIPECELIGINYGDEIDLNKFVGKDVYMVDFCLEPFWRMGWLKDYCKLIWIDHHKSSIEEYDKQWKCESSFYIEGNRSIDKAGCELTWEYFTKEPIPIAVKLLGRYDVWDLNYPNYEDSVLPFQYGLRSIFPSVMNPENRIWEKFLKITHQSHYLVKAFIWDIIEEGRIVLNYEKSMNETIMKNCSFEGKFLGYNAIFLNRSLVSSKTFESRYDESKHDLMISFYLLPTKVWTVSLYTTKENIDCSEMAKRFGGGGHRKASGFQTKKLWFLEE